ncbi:MAG: hypoxanthine phosphoribosyltransferase [Mycoplasmataceae bacterium]|jgi:hypoxanthine phosphoribosyltransferase|nr:hypoxanthine phosphoribosyltransferase [Mycoplasmataceae bacterium]
MHKDVQRVLVDNRTIKQKVRKLANVINKDYKHKKPILIGILKGCLPFYNELFLQLTCDPTMDFMIVSSYAGVRAQNVKIVADLRQNIAKRHVVIVEDIVDTGKTLERIIAILKLRKPASIKVVCLLDKPNCRIGNFKPDYTCFKIDPVFAIGYGLDYNERYRNLPYIGELKKLIYAKMSK